MIVAGEYQTLRIGRIAEPGIYLTDEQDTQLQAAVEYVSSQLK